MFLRLNLKLNFLLKTKLRPGLNGNPFFSQGKALAKKDWEWKTEKVAIKKMINYLSTKSKCRPKKTPTEVEVFKFICNAITL